MVVGDDEVAALRALLAGESAEYVRRYTDLDAEATRLSYKALIMAAFAEAVGRRFGAEPSWGEVVAFITRTRRRPGLAAGVDPVTAERAILAVHTEETTADIAPQELLTTKLLLLAALGADLAHDDTDLERFLTTARTTADALLS